MINMRKSIRGIENCVVRIQRKLNHMGYDSQKHGKRWYYSHASDDMCINKERKKSECV